MWLFLPLTGVHTDQVYFLVVEPVSIMLFFWLAGTAIETGESKTHGEPTGDKTVLCGFMTIDKNKDCNICKYGGEQPIL